MYSTNYYNTFIALSEDCPAKEGTAPPSKNPPTAAQIEYEHLAGKPYHYTSDEVLFAANGARRGLTKETFFAKGQPCFCASALLKRYGWGIHFDAEGKIAIYGVETPEYQKFLADVSLKQLKAMRSKRG